MKKFDIIEVVKNSDAVEYSWKDCYPVRCLNYISHNNRSMSYRRKIKLTSDEKSVVCTFVKKGKECHSCQIDRKHPVIFFKKDEKGNYIKWCAYINDEEKWVKYD